MTPLEFFERRAKELEEFRELMGAARVPQITTDMVLAALVEAQKLEQP